MEERKLPVAYHGSELEIAAYVHAGASDQWLLCLHGLQTSRELFQGLLQRSPLNGYSSLSIDFVGFGDSSKPQGFSYDLRDQARICERLISDLGMKNIYVTGHSMGGMVGTLLLDMIPDKITGFVNLEGNLVAKDCGASRDVAQTPYEEFRQHGFDRLKRNIAESEGSNTQGRVKWVGQIPAHAFYRASTSIVAYSDSGELLPLFLKAPARKLYVYGNRNEYKIAPLERRVDVARIPKAGHFMFQDNFEATAQVIENFVLTSQ
ncbi:alpha/beta hydrolase [Candidatus Woesearchaeota archaeon]|nr:alpha/beta hydrolase [Candidatus Woesearchaeota archaeon]